MRLREKKGGEGEQMWETEGRGPQVERGRSLNHLGLELPDIPRCPLSSILPLDELHLMGNF